MTEKHRQGELLRYLQVEGLRTFPILTTEEYKSVTTKVVVLTSSGLNALMDCLRGSHMREFKQVTGYGYERLGEL